MKQKDPYEKYIFFEWSQYKNLKKGEKYKVIHNNYVIEAFFCSYIDDFHREREYHSNCNAIFIEKYKKFNIMVLVDRCWKFYRFVSEKEYNSKIRDKFNENVLQTILKKLINDDFKW